MRDEGEERSGWHRVSLSVSRAVVSMVKKDVHNKFHFFVAVHQPSGSGVGGWAAFSRFAFIGLASGSCSQPWNSQVAALRTDPVPTGADADADASPLRPVEAAVEASIFRALTAESRSPASPHILL